MRPYADLPYWYNERANVGYVAQAANELGLAFLEEYTVNRGQGSEVHPGRGDLWIGDAARNEYEFEFKMYWASINTPDETLAENIEWYLDDAQEQLTAATRIVRTGMEDKPDKQPSQLSMVFVCPSVVESDQGRWKELLKGFVDRIARPEVYGNGFSTVFVPPDDMQGSNRIGADDYLYPAIAVFGRTVR